MARILPILACILFSLCVSAQVDPWALASGADLTSFVNGETIANDNETLSDLVERQTRCPPGSYQCATASWCCPSASRCSPEFGFGIIKGCCPTSANTCGGWACALPGTICCQNPLVCDAGQICCNGFCCPGGTTCGTRWGQCINPSASPSPSRTSRRSTSSSRPVLSITISKSTSISTSVSTRVSTSVSISTSRSTRVTSTTSSSSISISSRKPSSTSSSTESETSSSTTTSSTSSECEVASPSKRTPGPQCPTECHPESPFKGRIPVLRIGRVSGFSSQLTNHICRGIRTTSATRVAQGRSDGQNYDILTRGTQSGIDSRRTASGCDGYCSSLGLNTKYPNGVSCDEYPPASAAEGGPNADIQCINRWQNEVLGGGLLRSLFYDEGCDIAENDPFIIRIVPGCPNFIGRQDDTDENTQSIGNSTVINVDGLQPFIALPIDELQSGHYNLNLGFEDPSSINFLSVYDKYGTQYTSIENPQVGSTMDFEVTNSIAPNAGFGAILMAQTDRAQNISVNATHTVFTSDGASNHADFALVVTMGISCLYAFVL